MNNSKVIAIGALGGSGSRLVAKLISDMGIYIGDDLNHPLDNLIYTRLFKNPEWYENSSAHNKMKRLNVFAEYMDGQKLSLNQKLHIIKAAFSNPLYKSDIKFYSKILFRKEEKQRKEWAWKEPNTHFYIKEISNFFPNLKFIHVVRHGLDMAFSKNINQLVNWGYKYDLKIDNSFDKSEVARKQLDFWIKANNDSIETGKKLLKDNFYLLNYDNLCSNPDMEIKKLLLFLNIDLETDLFNRLINYPLKTSTFRRYQKEDLSIFDNKKIDEVKKLGFTVKP